MDWSPGRPVHLDHREFSGRKLPSVHQRQGAQPPLEMPLQVGGYQPVRRPAGFGCGGLRLGPVRLHQVGHQLDGARRRPRRPAGSAGRADRATGRDVEILVRAGGAAHCTVAQCRFPSRRRHRPQQEGVEHQPRLAIPLGQGTQRSDDQQVQPQRGLALFGGEPFGRLADGRHCRPATVVRGDLRTVGGDRFGLGDRVQLPVRRGVGALRVAGEQLDVDLHARLQACTEFRGGPSHPFADGADPAVPAGQQRDDPVGLAQLVHA